MKGLAKKSPKIAPDKIMVCQINMSKLCVV